MGPVQSANMSAAAALIAGLILLYLGAEWFVKGAAGLGHLLGMRPLVVGLTIVAYGTSMPELVVSTIAAASGGGAIALGNVIGSNIANIGLVLGVAALVRPLEVEGSLIRREMPVMLAAAAVLPIMLASGEISRVWGAVLLAGAAAFTLFTVRITPADAAERAGLVEADSEAAGAPAGRGRLRLAVIGLAGLALLLGGGRLFVNGAAALALSFGISQRVIGLTVVALGTSAPELASSIVAGVRGHAGIAIGNVVGSNIFNVVFVLGAAAIITPIPATLRVFGSDIAVVAGFSIAAAFLARQQRVITRAEGFVLTAAYLAYIGWLVVQA